MNNETGTISAKMHIGKQGKIIPCSVHPGSSIGYHKHETSDDINYVISGNGKAICDGHEEILYCRSLSDMQKGLVTQYRKYRKQRPDSAYSCCGTVIRAWKVLFIFSGNFNSDSSFVQNFPKLSPLFRYVFRIRIKDMF